MLHLPARSTSLRVLAAIILVALVTAAFALVAGDYARGQARAAMTIETGRTARAQIRLLDSELQKFRLLPIVLGEYPELRTALAEGRGGAATRLDAKLAMLAARTGASVIYLIDRRGLTVAASNAGRPDSFVGNSYEFRPYFVNALRDGAAEFFAIGTISGRPGLYLSRRIADGVGRPSGVIVVKVELDTLARAWAIEPGRTMLADAAGVVTVATDPADRFTTLRPLAPAARRYIAATRQFGAEPLPVTRYRMAGGQASAPDGTPIIVATIAAPLPGWRLVHLRALAPALRSATAWVRAATLAMGLFAASVATLLLWRHSRGARALARRAALEDEVAGRTRELSAANARLTVEITERERADRRFRAAREELAQANRLGSLGSITAGLAHEINQPVATIRTLAENGRLFLDRDRTDRTADNLTTIVALTERIGSIVSEMRRFARRGTFSLGPIPLAEVIEGTLLLIGDRVRVAGVGFVRPATSLPLPTVVAGRVRLEQVLVNLIQNALDAVAGQPDPRIALTVVGQDGEGQEGEVLVTVADNGSGIDPALATEIFTPFVTGKPEGLGLGLGIARDIMTEFGGMLEIVPSALGGAAFRATLRRG